MTFLRHLPIEQKLRSMILLVCGVVLLLACAALLGFQSVLFRRTVERDLSTLGELLAAHSTAALTFEDRDVAAETLAALKAKPEIVCASLFTKDGSGLAHYGRETDFGLLTPHDLGRSLRVEGQHIVLIQPIRLEREMVGTLYLRADFRRMFGGLSEASITVLATVLVCSLLLGLYLASRLQRVISEPILQLAQTAKAVAERHDFSVRATKMSDDELGSLTDTFNQMLAQVEERDRALQHINTELTNQMARRHEAEESRVRLAAIIEATPDFVGSADARGGAIYMNRAARRMVGLEEREPIEGRSVDKFHPDWAAQVIFTEALPIAAEHGSWVGETALQAQDGTIIEVSQVVVAHRGADGQVESYSTIARDISERKRAEAKTHQMQAQLLEASRYAGMAEVATGVLHNVGNVLNSVNVSATLVAEGLRHSKVSSLSRVSALLDQHAQDLGTFLSQDPKGRQLPSYLAALFQHLGQERESFLKEIELLRKNIDHIKDIVAMQQSYAKVAGVIEQLSVAPLVEDALRITAPDLNRYGVRIVREFVKVPSVMIDKHKVLQILVNLISNAKSALVHADTEPRQLTLRVGPSGETHVKIEVADNGVGIPPENLTKIFGHGFTTKKEGHGFGLHSGALAAKEMGGSLGVHSEGLGRGATFTLELPLRRDGDAHLHAA